MRDVFGIVLVVSWAVCLQAQLAVFPVFPPGFGDRNDPVVREQFLGSCANACQGNRNFIVKCAYNHPYACNLYVECLRFGGLWVVYGRTAPIGNVYDERDQRLKEVLPSGRANASFCLRVGHPCVTGRPIPIDGSQCGGFMECKNNTLVPSACGEGRGFSAWTGGCDLFCDKTIRKVLNRTCGPSTQGRSFFQINETVTYGDGMPAIERVDTTCPAATSYQVDGKCGCDHTNETAKGCETITALHLDSKDNSWELARNDTPVMGSSTIDGDAIVRPNQSAFFSGGQSFVAPGLNGNDLGLYFGLEFTFQAVRADNSTPGVLDPSGTNEPLLIALIDNSANNQEPTYGCRLRVTRTNFGQVECYVAPSKASDLGENNDKTEASPEIDLRGRVTVLFEKDNTKGKLTVTAEGSQERTTELSFLPGVRAFGNGSPMTIASGRGKTAFTGYMDNVDLKKYCNPFM